jgi:hypothetical protein
MNRARVTTGSLQLEQGETEEGFPPRDRGAALMPLHWPRCEALPGPPAHERCPGGGAYSQRVGAGGIRAEPPVRAGGRHPPRPRAKPPARCEPSAAGASTRTASATHGQHRRGRPRRPSGEWVWHSWPPFFFNGVANRAVWQANFCEFLTRFFVSRDLNSCAFVISNGVASHFSCHVI